jgi:hypothetical protein
MRNRLQPSPCAVVQEYTLPHPDATSETIGSKAGPGLQTPGNLNFRSIHVSNNQQGQGGKSPQQGNDVGQQNTSKQHSQQDTSKQHSQPSGGQNQQGSSNKDKTPSQQAQTGQQGQQGASNPKQPSQQGGEHQNRGSSSDKR